jgi:hypothetical protein
VDIFTDILGLIVLNKKQKEAEEEAALKAEREPALAAERDKMKDSQMIPLKLKP